MGPYGLLEIFFKILHAMVSGESDYSLRRYEKSSFLEQSINVVEAIF